MHCNIGSPIEHCTLNFFDENTLTSHLVKWNIGALIAHAFHKNQFALNFRVLTSN
jgi:hypothetical protein